MSNSMVLKGSYLEPDVLRYMREVNKIPMLAPGEEMELARLVSEERDIDAAHKLVTSHLRLVVKIAMKYRWYGLSMLDMISEGNIGLMNAVKKFDYKMGYKLATYAMWWIKAAIQDYIIKSWSLVKIGSSKPQKTLFFNLRKIKQKLMAVHCKNNITSEIAKIAREFNVSEREVVEMDIRMSNNEYIDTVEDGEISGSSKGIELIPDTSTTQEDTIIALDERKKQVALLANAMQNVLDERERHIVIARTLHNPPVTLQELSEKYSVSKERIRQVTERALSKLKNYILNAEKKTIEAIQ